MTGPARGSRLPVTAKLPGFCLPVPLVFEQFHIQDTHALNAPKGTRQGLPPSISGYIDRHCEIQTTACPGTIQAIA
ncbi:hypothetical protein ACET3X_004104 [Alternaria dauci]|uniref:Uncharacterized protein n=1 Tax=Alternaria dauci TaxID=48095 RepID=A0ABR3UM09_9PLEO